MPTFPSLTAKPIFPVTEQREDSVIKSDFEGGYINTRQRFTRIRRNFQVQYTNMSTSDKGTLDTFVDTVKGGADSFTWTHPITAAAHTVRFETPPRFSPTHDNRWSVEFTLIEL